MPNGRNCGRSDKRTIDNVGPNPLQQPPAHTSPWHAAMTQSASLSLLILPAQHSRRIDVKSSTIRLAPSRQVYLKYTKIISASNTVNSNLKTYNHNPTYVISRLGKTFAFPDG